MKKEPDPKELLESVSQKDSVDSEAVSLTPHKRAAEAVSWPLRLMAAWAWRILVILLLLTASLWLLGFVSVILFSFLVALLLALLLGPLVYSLRKNLSIGKTWSAIVGLLTGIAVVAALAGIAISELAHQLPQMIVESVQGINHLLDWVTEGPIPIENVEAQDWLKGLQTDLVSLLRDNTDNIASGAMTVASSAASVGTGVILTLFMLFFFLRDGQAMWIVAVRSLPSQWRNEVNEAGIRGWVTLGSYVTTQIKVAAIDAVGIGLGAFFLGVPMAIPIAILVFLASFVPIVGAFVSGAVAVLLALVNKGMTTAIIMLLVVLAVQQIESNVLHPLLMSHAVSLHPVVVVVAVTAGAMTAGIAGAVFAVPLVAFLNVTIQYLHGHDYYPYLASDPERPGGPPGSLKQQISDSYVMRTKSSANQPKKKRLKQVFAARKVLNTD